MRTITCLLLLVLCAGCASVMPNTHTRSVPDYTQTGGSVTITLLKAPDWTPGQPIPARQLDKMLLDAFGVSHNPDDVWYLPVPRDVADWAWAQIALAQTQGVAQIVDYLSVMYGADPSTRQYDTWLPESNDCDDYAVKYSRIARLIIGIRYGLNGATPAIGVLHVEQVQQWAGVPADGGHALCWEVVTNEDGGPTVEVREPQNGEAGTAESYPNKAFDVFGVATPDTRKGHGKS